MNSLDVARDALAVIALAISTYGLAAQTQQIPERENSSAAKEADGLNESRRMIDRGNGADALKLLNGLAAQQPVPAGVNTLRGVALYAQNRFAEADTAFAIALKENARDEEAMQMRGGS